MAHVSCKFEWTESDSRGESGWVPTKLRDVFDASNLGRMIAHDTMEHFLLDGTVEDEMMAFGQIYFIRTETGRISNYEPIRVTNEALVGRDMADLYTDTEFAPIKSIRQPADRNDNLEILRDVEASTRKEFMSNLNREERDDPENAKHADQWFTDAYRWLQRGYLKAIRRWAGKGSLDTGYAAFEAADMFWQLADELTNLMKQGEFFEGNTMAVHCNIKRRSYNIVFGSRVYDPRRF